MQVVAALLCQGAITSVRNQYGNDPIALTSNSTCSEMIRRVTEDGEKERGRLKTEMEELESKKLGEEAAQNSVERAKYVAAKSFAEEQYVISSDTLL